MLLPISKKVSACYERAGVCRARAKRAADEAARAAFLRIEASWIKLARSLEHAERIDLVRRPQQPTGPLVFRCPRSGLEIPAGIETSYDSLARAWGRSVQVHCGHCQGEHPMPLRDGYLRLRRP